jgi:PASTA domain
VTLTVTYDGASDTKSIDISAADRCTIADITGSPVGLQTASQATVRARVSGCFTAGSGEPAVTRLAEFLHVVVPLSVTPDGNGGGTASITIGTGPADPPSGTTANALRLELPNGAAVDWSVQTLDPRPTVPDEVGNDVGTAVTDLRALGYEPQPVKVGTHPDCPPGDRVVSQSPAPGTSAARGSVVILNFESYMPTERPPRPCP